MSEATANAKVFVSAHLDQAAALGEELSELTEDAGAFVASLKVGLAALEDPAYTAMAERVSPEVPATLVVRAPLVDAIQRPVVRSLREGSSISALHLADRLIGAPERSVRLFALPALDRALREDPEQTWQLMRRMGRGAGDWSEVDALADIWAKGVLAEPFRWAELEQLVFSQRTYERRIVGAALATIPHRVPTARRAQLRPDASRRAMEIIGQLMGDAESTVQKSLSWAIREWTAVDPEAVATLLRAETDIAARRHDGARAWVIRDALSKQPSELAIDLRTQLAGLRRDPDAPSTSIAASHAASYGAMLADVDDSVAVQGARYTRSHA